MLCRCGRCTCQTLFFVFLIHHERVEDTGAWEKAGGNGDFFFQPAQRRVMYHGIMANTIAVPTDVQLPDAMHVWGSANGLRGQLRKHRASS